MKPPTTLICRYSSGMVKHRHHSAGIPHNKTVSAEVTQPEQARQSERVTWPICAWATGSYSQGGQGGKGGIWTEFLTDLFMTFHNISWHFLWYFLTFYDARFLILDPVFFPLRLQPWVNGTQVPHLWIVTALLWPSTVQGGPRMSTEVHGESFSVCTNHGELVLLLCNGKKNQIRRPQQWAGGAHQRKSVVLGAGTWLLHGILLWPAKPSVTGLLVPVPLVKVTLNLFGMLVPLPLPVQKVTLETAVCGLLGPVKPSAGCCFPVSERFRRSTTRLPKTFTGFVVPVPLVKVTLNLFGVLVPLPLPF